MAGGGAGLACALTALGVHQSWREHRRPAGRGRCYWAAVPAFAASSPKAIRNYLVGPGKSADDRSVSQ